MAYLLSSERPTAAAVPASLFAKATRWLVDGLRANSERRAVRSLLDLDDARLADLGVTRSDIYQALRGDSRHSGLSLARSRARRSALPFNGF